MENKLRKSYRLDKTVVDRIDFLAQWLSKENGIKFTQTDVITYLTNWTYSNIVPLEDKE